jgi:phage antirepressor YoqD-like protein
MNAITNITAANLTMSSKEIAELTEKQHKDVMRDIRVMLDDLDETSAQFCADVQDSYGRKQPAFTLPKDLTLTLVAGYNVKLRKRIIDRWLELEEKAHNPIAALSRVDLLKLALDSEEKRLELETKVSELAPKAQALDRISTAEGSVCPTDAAKNLQVQPKVLFRWLQEHKWLYRRVGCPHYCGYQDKIQTGLVEQKMTTVTRSDGTEKTVEQARITPKGLAKLAEVGEFRAVA